MKIVLVNLILLVLLIGAILAGWWYFISTVFSYHLKYQINLFLNFTLKVEFNTTQSNNDQLIPGHRIKHKFLAGILGLGAVAAAVG